MKALCDTHTLVWWLQNSPKLGPNAKAILEDPENTILVSAVSAFEMASKFRRGKWPNIGPLVDEFRNAVESEGFELIGISTSLALMAGSFSSPHRDPFDRLLAAPSVIEDCAIITADNEIKNVVAKVI